MGASVEVLERSPEFKPLGAGITIQANAHAVLSALGVAIPAGDAIPIGPFRMINSRGQTLMRGDPSNVDIPIPSVNIHRADLHQALMRRADELEIPCHEDTEVLSFTERERYIEVKLPNNRREKCQLLVGADGVKSTIRRVLRGSKNRPLRMSRQWCWRFAMPVAEEEYPTETIEHWAPGRRVGVVPLPKGMVYSYLVMSHWWRDRSLERGSQTDIRTAFAGISQPIDRLLAQLGETPVHSDELGDQPEIDYGAGRVLLIGDAAHAMTPNLGQGAGMAIEDAAEVALLYDEHRDQPASISEGLAARRKPRVSKVQNLSWRIGQVAHVRNPLLRRLRDTLLRFNPTASTEQQVDLLWKPGIRIAERLSASLDCCN